MNYKPIIVVSGEPNSVIPGNFLFRKYFLEIGPLIILFVYPDLISLKAIEKDSLIYFEDLFDIGSNFLKMSYFTSIILINELSSL